MSTAIRFLVSMLSLSALLFAQGSPDLQGSPELIRQFGEPGEPGSFRVGVSARSAGILWLQATDHYVSVEKAQHEERQTGDYLLLIDNTNSALRMLRAEGGAFAADPADADWKVAERVDGYTFTLDDGEGLVLEKVLRHDAAQRGFVLEVTLRNVSSDAVGTQAFSLLGPALVVPKQSSLFGDVAVSIAAPIEGEAQHVKAAVDGKLQQLDVAPDLLSFAGSSNRFFGAFLYPLDEASRANLTQFEVLTVAPILDVDLNPLCCIDIPGGRFMAKFLIGLLGTFYNVLGNWGFAIIMLTILVRGSMFPLNFKMQKSMRAYGSKMAKLKPQLDALKTQYGDDQKGYQQAMIEFQRENKIMPPIGGCLPIFLTMPIYLGLFTALRTAYDLRQEPWMFWVEDLSASDALATLPFWPGVLNLLPLLWIGLFVFLTLRQPLPTDPQQRQMQMMMRFMPILFGVMLYNYASALLLYMVTSMLWSLVESTIVKKILGPIDPNASAMAPTPI